MAVEGGVQSETWCTCRSPMVTVASGHRVNAEHHQGNEEGHLQRPSWPPPQFHPKKGTEEREGQRESKEGGSGHEKRLEPPPPSHTNRDRLQNSTANKNIALWTSRTIWEVNQQRSKETMTGWGTGWTWGRMSSHTHTCTVGRVDTAKSPTVPLCYQHPFMPISITLGLTFPIFKLFFWQKVHDRLQWQKHEAWARNSNMTLRAATNHCFHSWLFCRINRLIVYTISNTRETDLSQFPRLNSDVFKLLVLSSQWYRTEIHSVNNQKWQRGAAKSPSRAAETSEQFCWKK